MSPHKGSQFAVLVVVIGILAITFGTIPHWSGSVDEIQPEPNADRIKSMDAPKKAAPIADGSRHNPERAPVGHNNQETLVQLAGIIVVDGRISIAVENEPLRGVLESIAKQTGIAFYVAHDVENRPISVQLHDLSSEQALRSLLTGFDAFYYVSGQDSAPPSLRTVWVYPQDRGRALTPLENWTDVVEQPMQVESNTKNDADAATETFVEMARDDDPAVRIQGLSAFVDSSEPGDATLRLTLEAALADRDASVRAFAIQALGSRGGEEAMGHLWEALSDPDPSVRAMAVETVDPQAQGITLLEVAASDSDEMVRSAAEFRLQNIGREER